MSPVIAVSLSGWALRSGPEILKPTRRRAWILWVDGTPPLTQVRALHSGIAHQPLHALRETRRPPRRRVASTRGAPYVFPDRWCNPVPQGLDGASPLSHRGSPGHERFRCASIH